MDNIDYNMFNGVFIKGKGRGFWAVCFFAGIALIVYEIIFGIADPEKSRFLILLCMIIGFLVALFSAFVLLMNHGAFFTVDLSAGTVKAKYGLFGHIDCRIDDIAFVYPQINVLSILFKNGKRCMIPSLQNSRQIAYVIRMGLFTVEKEPPRKFQDELNEYRRRYKKSLKVITAMGPLMMANILVTVLLTGGRSMTDYTLSDWFIFYFMATVGVGIVAITMIYTNKNSKNPLPTEWAKYRLNGAVLASHPLPSNNVRRVFMDADNTLRITVCGFPNDESVFFVVEIINEKAEVNVIHTSEVYSKMADLSEDEFDGYIDVTEEFV